MTSEPYVLYGKPGCHLCEQAAAALRAAGFAFSPSAGPWVREESILGRPELEAAFLWDIPVLVSPDGAVAMKGVFSPERLARLAASPGA
ncbi:MAG TPA: glutaredoxin family protein [Deinococcales bacterium]|nr:glutaredoxin family protein [Deinococcales bacterium]